jgi:hypothetical protein
MNRCPVCGRHIACSPLSENPDVIVTETDEGTFACYHRSCWDAVLETDDAVSQ